MILGFDIGNTVTCMGWFRPDDIEPDGTLRFETIKDTTPEILEGTLRHALDEASLAPKDVSGVAISSVVPEINGAYRQACSGVFSREIFEINDKSELSVTLDYRDPSQLGADRIANAVAAFSEYGGDCVIADMGTAVTFTVVVEGGRLAGGIIAPGVGTAISALASRASRLPSVPFERPPALIATDTVNAVKSGLFYGWISLIEGITARIEKEYRRSFRLIITGGFSIAVAGHMGRPGIHDPQLTMKGIKMIFDLNHRGK